MFFRRQRSIPRTQELVFLDTDDDLSTIRSKLEASAADEIFLVIPRRSAVLRTPLEFRILARLANELSSETVLVTEDGGRRRLAQQEGFRTRRSLRTLKHLMLAPGERAPQFVVPDWFPLPTFGGLLGLLIAAIALAAVALVGLPQMTVTLQPQSIPINRTVDVVVDPGLKTPDPSSGGLPGAPLSDTEQVFDGIPVPTTTVPGDKATGNVMLTNSGVTPIQIPQGTIVQVPSGPQFLTNSPVTLAPSTPATVAVTAASGGASGNVGVGAVTQMGGTGFTNVTVMNLQPTANGTDTTAGIVTTQVRQQLHDLLLQEGRDKALSALRSQAGAGATLPDESLQANVDSEQYSPDVGAQATELTGHMTVTMTGTAFDNAGFNNLVAAMLVQSAGAGFQLSGDPKLQLPAVTGTKGQTVLLQVQGSAVAVRQIDASQVGSALRGKTPAAARSYLAGVTGLAHPADVTVSPVWAPVAFRVNVDVQEAK